MIKKKAFCERCGYERKRCNLLFKTPPPHNLTFSVIIRGEYGFFDLFAYPPESGDGWTGAGELRPGKTDCDVEARIMQLKNLISWHGVRNGWDAERIATLIKMHAYPMRDSNDPVLNCYNSPRK